LLKVGNEICEIKCILASIKIDVKSHWTYSLYICAWWLRIYVK